MCTTYFSADRPVEIIVPEKTTTIIVRCGLGQSGKIWFDNVSLKIISPGTSRLTEGRSSPGQGFQATDESLRQLEKIRALCEKLMNYSREQLGEKVKIRKEIFAQGGGKFQIGLLFDLSVQEED